MEIDHSNSRKIMKFPQFITINNNKVEVVNNFELLGVTIDSNFSFYKYTSEMRLLIHKRLYSIKIILFALLSILFSPSLIIILQYKFFFLKKLFKKYRIATFYVV